MNAVNFFAPEIAEKDQQSIQYKGKQPAQPSPVSFEKHDHYYRVEIPVAGVNAGDISVLLHDHLLEVVIRPAQLPGGLSQKLYTVSYELALPEDADIEFGAAEYRNNTLTIHLSRFAKTIHCTNHQLVVY